MITLIEGLPQDTVGAKYSGKVTEADYRKVMIPAIEARLNKDMPVNFLIVIEDDFEKLSLRARMEDVFLDDKHGKDFGRIAIVTSNDEVAKMVREFAAHKDNLARVYTPAEMDQAKEWATGLGA